MQLSHKTLGIFLMVWGIAIGCEKDADQDEVYLPEDLKVVGSQESLSQDAGSFGFDLYFQGGITDIRMCESSGVPTSCDGVPWQAENRPSPIALEYAFQTAGERVVLVEARFQSGAVHSDHMKVKVEGQAKDGAGVSTGGETGNGETTTGGTTIGGTTAGETTAGETIGGEPGGGTNGETSTGQSGSTESAGSPSGEGHGRTSPGHQAGEGVGSKTPEDSSNIEHPTNVPSEAPVAPALAFQMERDGKALGFKEDRFFTSSAEGVDLIVQLPADAKLESSKLQVAGKSMVLCGDEGCVGNAEGSLKFRLTPQDLTANAVSELKFSFVMAGDEAQTEFSESAFLFYDAEAPASPGIEQFTLRDVPGGTKISWDATVKAETQDQVESYRFKVCPEGQICEACDAEEQVVDFVANHLVMPGIEGASSTQICVASREFSGHHSTFEKLGYSTRMFGEELADDSFINRAQFFAKGKGLPLMQDFAFSHNEGVGQGAMSGIRVMPDFGGQNLKVFTGLYDPPQFANLNGATRWTYVDRPESQAFSVRGVCTQADCRVTLDSDQRPEGHGFFLVGFNMRFRGLTQSPTEIKIIEEEGTLQLNLGSDHQDSFYYHIAYTYLPTYLIQPESVQNLPVNVEGVGSFARSQDFKVGTGLIRGFHVTFDRANDRIITKGHVARANLVPMMGTSHPRSNQAVVEALSSYEVSPKAPANVRWSSTTSYGAVGILGQANDPRQKGLMFLACERDDCRCDTEPTLFSDFGQTFLPLTEQGAVNACVASVYDEDGMNVSSFTRTEGRFHGVFHPEARFEGKRDVILENLAPKAGGIKDMTVAFCTQSSCGGSCFDHQTFSTQQLQNGAIRKAMRVQGAKHGDRLHVCVKAKDQNSLDLGWKAIKETTLERQVCVYEHANYGGWKQCSSNLNHKFTKSGMSSVKVSGNVCARLYRQWHSRRPRRTHTINRVIHESTHYVGDRENDRLHYVEVIPCP